MSSSDEDEEDTGDEEEEEKPSAVPELSDTDDSDDEGAGNSNDSGRSSPEQPESNEGSDDDDANQDPKERGGYNGGHKNMLPGLISPGDSGIEDYSESEHEEAQEEEEQIIGDDHFKGTAFFEEYFDRDRNRPGSSKVEEHETKCKKLSTGDQCIIHKSEEDSHIVSYLCPLIATPNQCINPEHSEWDHEPVYCTDPEHSHEPIAKVINFITTVRHAGRNETEDNMDHEDSEDEGFDEKLGEWKVGWSYNPVKDVMRLTQRTAQQIRTLQPHLEMKAKRDLSDRDIIKLLLYCDSGSCLNLVSEKKARIDGVKIKQGPHPYQARDVQGKSLDIIGYAEYFLLNEHNYVRRIECAVSKYGSASDIIINLETLKLMGVVDENFPRVKNSKFEEGAENFLIW